MSDIPNQMHPFPTNSMVTYLNFCFPIVLSTGNKILANSLWEIWLVFQGCLIRIDLQDILHFDSLIRSNTFLCNFFLVFCFGWQRLHSRFLLFISTRQVGLTCVCIFKSSVEVFYRNSVVCLFSSYFWVWCISSS